MDKPTTSITRARAGYWNSLPVHPVDNPGGFDLSADGLTRGHIANFPEAVKAIGDMTEWVGEQAGAIAAGLSVIPFVWDSGTSASVPGAGKVRASTGALTAGSYSFYADLVDAAGGSATALLTAAGSSTSTVKARARLVVIGDPAKYVDVHVTAVAIGAYATIGATYLGGPAGFVAGDAVALCWVRTGDTVRWLSGAGGPANGNGNDGDYYLNTTTGGIYAKVAGSWNATGLVIKGADGTNGATWYSGTGAPGVGLGASGDLYFRTDNGAVYTKAAGAWSVSANLTGPPGAAGSGPVWYGTSTGSANAHALAGPLASLSGNPSVEWIAGYSNTGAMTLAVGSTAATAVRTAAGGVLAGGEVVAGTKYVSTYDGTYWRLSGAASSGGNTRSFTVTGTVSDGTKVALRSDGTVEAVSGTENPALGTGTSWGANYISYGIDSCYDSANQKVVLVYKDGGSATTVKAVVGTVSGTTISFGTPVTITTAMNNVHLNCVYDSANGKVIALMGDGSATLNYAVGTVSGTDITFGSVAAISGTSLASSAGLVTAAYDPGSGRVIVMYGDGATSNLKYVCGYWTSGTSMTWGTPGTHKASLNFYNRKPFAYVPAISKLVFGWNNYSDGNGYLCVVTISGTTATFGADQASTNGWQHAPVYDSGNSKLLVYSSSNSGIRIAAATVSGDTITEGAWTTVYSGSLSAGTPVYDASSQRVVCFYEGAGDSYYLHCIPVAYNGSTFSIGSNTTIVSSGVQNWQVAFVYHTANGRIFVAYSDSSSSTANVAKMLNIINTNADNWIGIAAGAATNSPVTVQLLGAVDDAQSGLTAGTTYYVAADGTLTSSDLGAARKIGRALSATTLYIEGQA